MQREGLIPLLSGRPAKAFPAEYDDLWYLYSAVRERQPTIVLEFGAGYSTSILAEALRRNGRGHLYSVDANEYWGDLTRNALPIELRKLTTISCVPAIPVDDNKWRQSVSVVPDFIYLDGPPLTKDRPIAIDLLDMEPRLPIGCFLVVDGRKTNTRYLRDHFSKDWSFSWNRIAQRAAFKLRH